MAAITKDMGIMEIVQKYPETIRVLQAFGISSKDSNGMKSANPHV